MLKAAPLPQLPDQSVPTASKHLGRSRDFAALYAAALLMPLVLFCAGAWWIWVNNLDAAYSRIERMSSSLAGYSERLIDIQETLLNSALNRVQGLDWDQISRSPEVHAFLVEQRRQETTVLGFSLIRPDTGRIIAWSDPGALPEIDVSDRDYVRHHRSGGAATFIGEVVKTRPRNVAGFTVSRRDSQTGTIAVSLLELGKVGEFFASLRESQGDVAALTREDGAVLVRLPRTGDPIGLRLPPESSPMQAIRGELKGITLHRGSIDDVYRYYDTRQVGQFPLFVAYGLSYDSVLTAWLRDLVPLALLSLAAMISLFLLARRVERSAVSQRQAEVAAASARLQALNAEKLAVSETRLRHASHAVGLTYVVNDYAEDRLTVADNYESVVGFALPDGLRIEEADAALLAHVAEPDRDFVQSAIANFDSGKVDVQNIEFRVLGGDGQERWIASVWTMERDSFGRPSTSFCTHLDITARKRQEEHQRMLMNELNHRVKNTLATIQSIATQTLRSSSDVEEARQRFEARLIALSKAHDVLTQQNWSGAPLRDVVRGSIAPYQGQDGGRFLVDGPNVRVPPRFTLALAMALHELCTNAVKYGALSNDKGKVRIAWAIEDDHGRTLRLRWSEEGGPPVKPPSRRGFGSRLIERGLASDLGGEVNIEFAPSGVICTIAAPLEPNAKRQLEAA